MISELWLALRALIFEAHPTVGGSSRLAFERRFQPQCCRTRSCRLLGVYGRRLPPRTLQAGIGSARPGGCSQAVDARGTSQALTHYYLISERMTRAGAGEPSMRGSSTLSRCIFAHEFKYDVLLPSTVPHHDFVYNTRGGFVSTTLYPILPVSPFGIEGLSRLPLHARGGRTTRPPSQHAMFCFRAGPQTLPKKALDRTFAAQSRQT